MTRAIGDASLSSCDPVEVDGILRAAFAKGEWDKATTCKDCLQVRQEQNKVDYAAHGHTAAEVIAAPADAGKLFKGQLSFAGSQPTRADIGVAKNYLGATELKRLNTLVSAYFDAAEFRAQTTN